MIICKYFVWFIIYSFMGWIYESTFCTIKAHKWQNRGFLHGPVVPIYGVGALAASILFAQLPVDALQEAGNLQVFLICFFGSMVLEYVTSWGLEKLFHAYWWDYSNVICNINGRICLPASVGFGLAGILVVRVIFPFVDRLTINAHPLLIEVLALLFMLVFAMDLALTVSALTDFARNLERIEKEINEQISAAYDNLENNLTEKKVQFQEKSQQLQGGAFVRKELRQERREERLAALKGRLTPDEQFAALRERLTRERLENLLTSSSWSQKHTLLHIKGFRRREGAKNLKELLQKILRP